MIPVFDFFFSFQCFVVVYSQFGVKGEIPCSVVTVHYDINIQLLILWKNKCIWENKKRTCLFWVGWRCWVFDSMYVVIWDFSVSTCHSPFLCSNLVFTHAPREFCAQEMCVYISVTQTFQYSAFIGPYCC